MASKSAPLLSLLLLSILLITGTSAQLGKKLVGGWQDIKDPKDPKIVEIGRFAVAEHNKNSPGLKLAFGRVTRGQYQVVSGINYRLYIAAGSGAATRSYVAVVYDKPWAKVRQLISFQEAP